MSDSEKAVVEAASAALSRAAVSEKEDNFVKNNVEYINKFMQAVEIKKDDISDEAKSDLLALRDDFDRVFKLLDDQSQEIGPQSENSNREMVPIVVSRKSTPVSSDLASVTDDSSISSIRSADTSDSTDSEISLAVSLRGARKKSKAAVSKKARKKKLDRVLSAVKKIDMRQVPKFDMYDEDSGVSLVVYLDSFEDYCRDNVRGDKKFWIGELESRLGGRTLKAFRTVKLPDDSWKSLRKKLVRWYSSDKRSRTRRYRVMFDQAKHEKGESMFLLATRVEKLFKTAFPDKTVETSQTLSDKLLDIVPSWFRVHLENEVVGRIMAHKVVKWSKIKQLASVCDSNNRSETKHDSSEEIVIHVASRSNQDSYNQNLDRRNRTFTSRSRFNHSSGFNRDNISRCSFCGKLGHDGYNCWIRTGACLVCGSSEHRIAACPKRVDRSRRESVPSAERYRSNSRDVRRPNDVYQSRSNTHLNYNRNRGNSGFRQGFRQGSSGQNGRPHSSDRVVNSSVQDQRNSGRFGQTGNGTSLVQGEVNQGLFQENLPLTD